MKYRESEIKRFYDQQIPEPMSGCFLWTGTAHGRGYGLIRVGSKKDGSRRSVLAHRMSCEIAYGDIPFGMQALHKCDNKACVNPSHLYIGTREDNTRDAMERDRLVGAHMPGESNPKAKLKEADVLAIRASLDGAASLAKKYGVNKVTIYDIKRGKTWSHLNGA